ncbi:hypothetical protein C2845_PM01G40270 [Panicum miliaceum]|uniref:Uncharacterized protein n=1 Tax=Panicum miliaceum TaxID=4540 RepID=A0A3L6TI10_PANMI|nr:hypothetical protein C2845_PM01G40270 [Panicum miliaceum]
MSEDESDSDSDSDDEKEFMLELGKMNKKSRETIIRLMKKIFEDEHTADAANESAQDREARRLRNRKRAKCRRDANDRRARIQRDLDAEFAAAQDAGFNTPAADIAGITAVLAGNPDPQVQAAIRMA